MARARRGCTLAAAVALMVICAGCASSPAPRHGAGATTTTTSTTTKTPKTTKGPSAVASPSTVHNAGDGLTVTMSAARGTQAAHSVTFTITASADHAPGALHYVVAYGDGMTAANTTPLVCQAAPGGPAQQSWKLTHTYPAKGTYAVTAQIGITCSPNLVGVTMRVTP